MCGHHFDDFEVQTRVRAMADAPLQSVFGHCLEQGFASYYAVMAIGRVKATLHSPPDAAECVLRSGTTRVSGYQATGSTI